MKDSPLPINGKKLAARWGIETIDLIYIMLNHGLNVVDHYLSKMGIDDVLEDFKKHRDTSDYMFSLSAVKDIETKLDVDGEIPRVDTIRGNELIARWDMNEEEILSLMLITELDSVDPFRHYPKFKTIFLLIDEGTLGVSDLLFRLSDVEDLESKYPEIVADTINDKKAERKLRPSQLHKRKCREVADRLWKEDPTLTIVDMAYKDEINTLFDGKIYTEKTIRNWIKDLNPNRSPRRRPTKK